MQSAATLQFGSGTNVSECRKFVYSENEAC